MAAEPHAASHPQGKTRPAKAGLSHGEAVGADRKKKKPAGSLPVVVLKPSEFVSSTCKVFVVFVGRPVFTLRISRAVVRVKLAVP
jgi:hypothetical protein